MATHIRKQLKMETIQQLALADEQHIAAAINITSPYAQPDLWMFSLLMHS